MIEVFLSLLAVLPQAQERIDFSLETGTILVAAAFFVLVNVLLGAALYPLFTEGTLFESEEETVSAGEETEEQKEMINEAPSDDGEELEEKVDEFLEDIHGERG